MMPRQFDFDQAQPAEHLRYMSATVDLDRAEFAPFDLGCLDPNRRLVVCSLGTHHAQCAERFLAQFAQAVSLMPHRQAVLNVGPTISRSRLPRADNVITARGIPQLTLLKHASLMVNQAGINSIKECVAAGVPMLCVPCGVDQPGTAARVVYHGLGVRADPKQVTAQQLVALIEAADSDNYRQNIKCFRPFFLDEESFQAGIKYIEQDQTDVASSNSANPTDNHKQPLE